MDKAKWRRLLIGEFSFGGLLKSLVSIYLLFGVLVYFFADGLMFHPQTSPPWTTTIPSKVGTSDGVILPAVHLPNPQTEDVMVLDFYNTAEDIKAAFDDFYTVTLLSGPTDVNLLHDLAETLADAGIYDQEHVERFAALYFKGAPAEQLSPLHAGDAGAGEVRHSPKPPA